MNDPQFNQQQYGSVDPVSGVPTEPVAPVVPADPSAGTPSGWAPQNTAPLPMPGEPEAAPLATNPYDQGGQPGSGQDMYPPTQQGSGGGSFKTIILIIILVLLIVAGGLVLASWQGWIKLGGLENLWGGEPKSSEQTTELKPTANANDSTRKTDLTNIKTALKAYYQVKQSYPVALVNQKTSDADNALNVLVPDYIAKLPVDPLSPSYYYGYKSDGKSFELTAALENKTDPEGTVAGAYYIYKITDSTTETLTSGSGSTGSTAGGSTTPSGTNTTTTTSAPASTSTDASTVTGTTTTTDSSSSSTGSGANANANSNTITN